MRPTKSRAGQNSTWWFIPLNLRGLRFGKSSCVPPRKGHYIQQNPVRAGLMASTEAWPWQGVGHH